MKLTEKQKQEIRIQKILAKLINFIMAKYDFEKDYVLLMVSPDQDANKLATLQTVSNIAFDEAFPIIKAIADNYNYSVEEKVQTPDGELTEITKAHVMQESKTIQ